MQVFDRQHGWKSPPQGRAQIDPVFPCHMYTQALEAASHPPIPSEHPGKSRACKSTTGRTSETIKKSQKHQQFLLKLTIFIYWFRLPYLKILYQPEPLACASANPATRSRGSRSTSRSRTRHRPRAPSRCKNTPELALRLVQDWDDRSLRDGDDRLIEVDPVLYNTLGYFKNNWNSEHREPTTITGSICPQWLAPIGGHTSLACMDLKNNWQVSTLKLFWDWIILSPKPILWYFCLKKRDQHIKLKGHFNIATVS